MLWLLEYVVWSFNNTLPNTYRKVYTLEHHFVAVWIQGYPLNLGKTHDKSIVCLRCLSCWKQGFTLTALAFSGSPPSGFPVQYILASSKYIMKLQLLIGISCSSTGTLDPLLYNRDDNVDIFQIHCCMENFSASFFFFSFHRHSGDSLLDLKSKGKYACK